MGRDRIALGKLEDVCLPFKADISIP